MTREELFAIAEDATRDAELRSGDIPAIDLYVDQIINLIATRLEDGSERYRDRQLTKTMINNYSKDGIIMPVKGKKYTKEQIMQILTVYSLKNTLSIGEIKRLLHGAYSAEDFGERELTAVYDRHQDIKNAHRTRALELLGDILEIHSLDARKDTDYVTTICALVSLSAYLKNIAQSMIDEKFPEIGEDDGEKDKNDKEKSKEKKEKDKSKKKKKDAEGSQVTSTDE